MFIHELREFGVCFLLKIECVLLSHNDLPVFVGNFRTDLWDVLRIEMFDEPVEIRNIEN